MIRLLSVLSGTLLISPCLDIPKNIAGYYERGTYNINVCTGTYIGEDFFEETAIHEIGHLYWFMYLKKIGSKKEQELYARKFRDCRIFNKKNCRRYLMKQIRSKVYKKSL